MKIVLLTPNFTKGIGFLGMDHFMNPSIGLGVIASILLAKGHDVVIKDPIVISKVTQIGTILIRWHSKKNGLNIV